jgi:hypothetical protein
MKHSKVTTRKVNPEVLTRVMARQQQARNSQTAMQGACTIRVYTARTEALTASLPVALTASEWAAAQAAA